MFMQLGFYINFVVRILFMIIGTHFLLFEVLSGVESVEDLEDLSAGFDNGLRAASCESKMGEGAEGEEGEGKEAIGARKESQRRSHGTTGSDRNRATDSPNGRIRCSSCRMYSISTLNEKIMHCDVLPF